MLETVANKMQAKVRRATLNGKEYLVAPLSLIVPGVLNGSKGSLFYPEDEIAKNYDAWNKVPIVVGHPVKNGAHISANDVPDSHIGMILEANVNGKLSAEGWFDVEATKKIDNRLYDKLNRNQQIELSTGLFTENEPTPGVWKGRPYDSIARNYKPDHLAILLDHVGACSIQDGCGVLVNVSDAATGGHWASLPNGVHVYIRDGEIAKGPKALTGKEKEEHDKKIADAAQKEKNATDKKAKEKENRGKDYYMGKRQYRKDGSAKTDAEIAQSDKEHAEKERQIEKSDAERFKETSDRTDRKAARLDKEDAGKRFKIGATVTHPKLGKLKILGYKADGSVRVKKLTQNAGGHWVTIGGQHIYIKDGDAGREGYLRAEESKRQADEDYNRVAKSMGKPERPVAQKNAIRAMYDKAGQLGKPLTDKEIDNSISGIKSRVEAGEVADAIGLSYAPSTGKGALLKQIGGRIKARRDAALRTSLVERTDNGRWITVGGNHVYIKDGGAGDPENIAEMVRDRDQKARDKAKEVFDADVEKDRQRQLVDKLLGRDEGKKVGKKARKGRVNNGRWTTIGGNHVYVKEDE